MSVLTVRRAVEAPLKDRLRWAVLGLISETPLDPWRSENKKITSLHQEWLAHSPPDRLSDAEIEENYKGVPIEVYMEDVAGRRDVFTSRPIEQTMQGLVVPLIREIIRRDPNVRAMLEIGCYYGFVDWVLAREFPHIQVCGVDLCYSVPAMNAEFKEPNLTFRVGYGLDLIERGEVGGDILYSTSTAVRFKNAELSRYLRAFKERGGRYVVFNEPAIPRPGARICEPWLLPGTRSLPVYYSASAQGMPPCFVHNYPAILRAAGYEVLHCRTYAPLMPQDFRTEVVGVVRQ